jgi:hypothetical protein
MSVMEPPDSRRTRREKGEENMRAMTCALLLGALLLTQAGCDDVLEDLDLDLGFYGSSGYCGGCGPPGYYEETYVEEYWYEETYYEDTWYGDSWFFDGWSFWPW